MPITTTVGQVVINSSLPEDMRRYDRVLNKKGVSELFQELSDKHPDDYAEVARKVLDIGHFAAQASGASISLSSLLPSAEVKEMRNRLRDRIEKLGLSETDEKIRERKIVELVSEQIPLIEDAVYRDGEAADSPFFKQVSSGARGNKTQLRQLVAGDLLVQDADNNTLAVPILKGYTEGLDPVEYFAASYGARKGVVDVKLATADAGFFGKKLSFAAHRLTVTEDDCGTQNGLPVDAGDHANVGAVMAMKKGEVGVGTILNLKNVKDLSALKGKIVIRSPLTCAAHSGVCSKCAGVRERGRLPDIGDNVGIAAAQAISEKISQGSLSSKHKGGVVTDGGDAAAGFEALDQQIEVPSSFRGAATLSQRDGVVDNIKPAPQGGNYIYISGEEHYVSPGRSLKVERGATVEAGDMLSDGVPNPGEITALRGLGDGRASWVKTFGEAMSDAGLSYHRRNLELVARGLINHVRVTSADGAGDALTDEVVPYDALMRSYKPRADSTEVDVNTAAGNYLERPVLHHTAGTRLTPKMIAGITESGFNKVWVNKLPPPFEPEFVRALDQAGKDPNPITRMSGSGLHKSILTGTARNLSSPKSDTSPYARLAEGPDFGASLSVDGTY